MSILLGTGILYPAFRTAGVTDRPMRTPSPDQVAEGIPLLNRMLGSWNCSRMNIFTVGSAIYALTANKITYQIGLTAPAPFNVASPQRITLANIILPGTPLLRQPLRILNDTEWARIRLQTLPGAITSAIYPDYNFPVGTISLYGQPSAGYQLELYTWTLIPKFAAVTDVVTLPDGYEEAMVLNLACRIAKQFPTQARMDPLVYGDAARSLAAIQSRNAPVRRLRNDAAGLGADNPKGGDWNWWRTGGYD